MDISLELQTSDVDMTKEAMLGKDATRGAQIVVDDGLNLRYRGMRRAKAIGVPDILIFMLSIPAGVTANVIADSISRYLHKKSIDCSARLIIHEQVEVIDPEGNRIIRNAVRYQEIPTDRRL